MSQLGADDWVLSKFPTGHKGFFLDVGAADGFSISNTLKLENAGWSGIAVDAFPRNFERRTKTVVESAVVAAKKGELVNFVVPVKHRDFSGIERNLGKHRDARSVLVHRQRSHHGVVGGQSRDLMRGHATRTRQTMQCRERHRCRILVLSTGT